MSKKTVLIVETGIANTASVIAGLTRAGANTELSSEPEKILQASHVVLPGVGAFGPGVETLRETGAFEALSERINAGQATLAVCLGMQLLCEASEEAPGTMGLGVLPIKVERFPETLKVPQLGWNLVSPEGNSNFVTEGAAYFANSYRLPEKPDGWIVSYCEYESQFVATVEKGAVLGCQFHPELSGPWGQEIINRWLNFTGSE